MHDLFAQYLQRSREMDQPFQPDPHMGQVMGLQMPQMPQLPSMGGQSPMSGMGPRVGMTPPPPSAEKAPDELSLGTLLGAQGGAEKAPDMDHLKTGMQAGATPPSLGNMMQMGMNPNRTKDNPRRFRRPGMQSHQNPYISGLMQF